MSMIKYRVHEVAKDFGIATKVISQILTDYVAPPKNHMQVLENNELDVIFEYMTQHNQVASLEEVFKVEPKAQPPPRPRPRRRLPRRRRALPPRTTSRSSRFRRRLPSPEQREEAEAPMFPARWRRSAWWIPAAARP